MGNIFDNDLHVITNIVEIHCWLFCEYAKFVEHDKYTREQINFIISRIDGFAKLTISLCSNHAFTIERRIFSISGVCKHRFDINRIQVFECFTESEYGLESTKTIFTTYFLPELKLSNHVLHLISSFCGKMVTLTGPLEISFECIQSQSLDLKIIQNTQDSLILDLSSIIEYFTVPLTTATLLKPLTLTKLWHCIIFQKLILVIVSF